MSNTEQRFYMCYFPIYIYIVVLSSLLFLVVLYIKKGMHIDPIGVVVALTAVMIVMVPMTRKLIKKMYISVNSHGIQAHDTYGKQRYVGWGEITKVKPLNLLIFKYLLVYKKPESKIIWVPLTVTEPVKFCEQVKSFIKQGNPLLSFLSSCTDDIQIQNMTEYTDKVNIPAVLNQFADELTNKQRPYVSIEATPLNCELDSDPLDLKQSKFLGNPFVPEDMAYPEDKHGNPLVLIAQINFSEVPELEGFPSDGILQLYFSSTEWWDMSGAEKIIYLSSDELKKMPKTDFSFISVDSYKELPVWKIHKLRFKKSIDTGNSEDCQFSFNFGGKDYWDFEETLNERNKEAFDKYFSSEGHKIHGYGDFTQGDPRDYSEEQRNDVQILQIDVDDEIMFGDSGIGHVFISPESLACKDFDKAYFYWDCC